MENQDPENLLLENYFTLIKNLSTKGKLRLISKLTESIKSDLYKKEGGSMKKAFGAWDENDDADDLITQIRSSRTFTRDIEEL